MLFTRQRQVRGKMHVKKQGCFYKNKNGDIRVSLTELMMSLLAIAVIVLMVYVGVRLVSMFSSSKDYDSTIASFDVLGERVDELIEDKNYANKNILVLRSLNILT